MRPVRLSVGTALVLSLLAPVAGAQQNGYTATRVMDGGTDPVLDVQGVLYHRQVQDFVPGAFNTAESIDRALGPGTHEILYCQGAVSDPAVPDCVHDLASAFDDGDGDLPTLAFSEGLLLDVNDRGPTPDLVFSTGDRTLLTADDEVTLLLGNAAGRAIAAPGDVLVDNCNVDPASPYFGFSGLEVGEADALVVATRCIECSAMQCLAGGDPVPYRFGTSCTTADQCPFPFEVTDVLLFDITSPAPQSRLAVGASSIQGAGNPDRISRIYFAALRPGTRSYAFTAQFGGVCNTAQTACNYSSECDTGSGDFCVFDFGLFYQDESRAAPELVFSEGQPLAAPGSAEVDALVEVPVTQLAMNAAGTLAMTAYYDGMNFGGTPQVGALGLVRLSVVDPTNAAVAARDAAEASVELLVDQAQDRYVAAIDRRGHVASQLATLKVDLVPERNAFFSVVAPGGQLTAGCPGAAPCTVQSLRALRKGAFNDAGQLALSLQVVGALDRTLVRFTPPDADGDGTWDFLEPGDGNGDATDDAQQAHVASVANRVDGTAVTVETHTGSLEQLESLPAPVMPPAPAAGADFPVGLLRFRITGLNPGETVDVDLYLDASVPEPTAYYKFTPSGPVLVAQNAAGLGNPIRLTLTDGAAHDADGVADGTITDPGGPAVLPEPGGGLAVVVLGVLAQRRRPTRPPKA